MILNAMSDIQDFIKRLMSEPIHSGLQSITCICACFSCGERSMLMGLFQSGASHLMSYYQFRHFRPAKGKRKKDCIYWVRKYPRS